MSIALMSNFRGSIDTLRKRSQPINDNSVKFKPKLHEGGNGWHKIKI